MTDSQWRQKFFALFFGTAFLAILGASLYQRFQNPDLTVTAPAQFSGQSMPEASDGIGALMRQAAQEPHNQALLLKIVENLLAIGEWAGAENFAQKALALDDPQKPNPRGLYLLALTHHNKGEHEQAAELLEKLLQNHDDPSARYSLAILNIHYLHKPEAGAEQLEKGLALPNLPVALKTAMQEELDKLSHQRAVPDKSGEDTAPEANTESRQVEN